ncbi:MAG TPA: redox-sensing transcriptional repressor Rex [Clostridiales bacterium]|nr:redox-sensing transcriptional repressor Rex [Clostridiales bacterium]
MDRDKKISTAVIRRLPKYYRYLKELLRKGIYKTSSKELSQMTGFSASQIRQDLNNFGGFGQQGFGYDVYNLSSEIGKIIGADKNYKIIIVGAGNIGQAIANYTGFYENGYDVVAIFDKNPKLIGLSLRNVTIQDIDEIDTFLSQNYVDLGVICTPKNAAQATADSMVQNGIKGIWNFAPTDIRVPDDVALENVHLNESLFSLTYYYNNNKTKAD